MGKLPYRRIDLVNVSHSGSGKRLPGPAVAFENDDAVHMISYDIIYMIQ
jgi:hypothetical protein